MFKVIKIILISLLGMLCLLFAVCLGFYIHWLNLKIPSFLDSNGKILKNSVASLEKVKIGGLEQTLLIRGKDKNNLVLLFLHGGPGSSEMPFVRIYNGKLEDSFIVVNWDLRGAGKTYSPFTPKESMKIEQFISDSHELVLYLEKRFNKKKIYLVGHSMRKYAWNKSG